MSALQVEPCDRHSRCDSPDYDDIDSQDSKITYNQAEAKAILFPSGPNKGKNQRLEVTNAGSGWIYRLGRYHNKN